MTKKQRRLYDIIYNYIIENLDVEKQMRYVFEIPETFRKELVDKFANENRDEIDVDIAVGAVISDLREDLEVWTRLVERLMSW